MEINFEKGEKEAVIDSIRKYFLEEMDLEIGEMKAGFVLKYFLEEIAPFAYNQGINDAERFFAERIADLPVSCFEEGLNFWKKK